MLGNSKLYGQVDLESYIPDKVSDKEIVYQVHGIKMRKERREDFKFAKGEVVTFLVLDRREKERLFLLLSGRNREEGISYIINSKRYSNVDLSVFAEEK